MIIVIDSKHDGDRLAIVFGRKTVRHVTAKEAVQLGLDLIENGERKIRERLKRLRRRGV